MSEPNGDHDESRPTPKSFREEQAQIIIKQAFESYGEWQIDLQNEMELAATSLKRQDTTNLVLSVYFAWIAAISLFVAGYLIFRDLAGRYFREDLLETIQLMTKEGVDAPVIAFWIVSWPIVLLLALVILSLFLALFTQSRGNRNFANSLERLSRLRREVMVGASRSTTMDRVLEETLDNARRAFSLQLAISRTLFFVGIALLAALVVSLILQEEFDLLAVMPIAGGSILSFLFAALTNPQRDIGGNLASITQLEAILAGYTRQAGIIEEYTYRIMERYRFTDPEKAESAMRTCISDLEEILHNAMDLIQNNVQKVKIPSVTERFMEQQGWISEQKKSAESST